MVAFYISIITNVPTYTSTCTLALLGFYMRSTFRRYNMDVRFWGDDLQPYMYKLTTANRFFLYAGEVHKSDHRRIIGTYFQYRRS